MRPPDLVGRVGKAWKVRLDPARLDDKARQLLDAGVALDSWIVQGPYHLGWDHWLLYAVDLKDVPGLPPAHRQYPEAQFSIEVWSLRPPEGKATGMYRDLDDVEAGRGGFAFLTPCDGVYQFHGVTQDEANDILGKVARLIADGGASPDSDWRSWWRVCIENTVRHYRGEAHLPEGGGA